MTPKKGAGLALIFGSKPKEGAEPADEVDTEAETDEGVPPDFEAAAGEAFPDLKGDPERMAAFHRACMACTGG